MGDIVRMSSIYILDYYVDKLKRANLYAATNMTYTLLLVPGTFL